MCHVTKICLTVRVTRSKALLLQCTITRHLCLAPTQKWLSNSTGKGTIPFDVKYDTTGEQLDAFLLNSDIKDCQVWSILLYCPTILICQVTIHSGM